MKKILVMSVVIGAAFLTGSVWAVSEAAKIGANAGAMSYCKDKFEASERGKYNLLGIRTLEVFSDLDGDDKAKAMVMKRAAEDGEYLGDPLTERRCDSLRKMLYLKYKD